jgi:hypothetical protein
MIQHFVLKAFIKSICSIFIVTLSTSVAQSPIRGPYTLTTYDADVLETRPGEVVVGTRVQTHLEFTSPIEVASSARSDWFTFETSGNRLSLRANQASGKTDLMVVSGGRVALFILRIDDALDAPRRYLIAHQVTPPPAVGRGAMPGADGYAADGPKGGEGELPAWLSFQAEAIGAPNGVLAIQYALANESPYPLATDAVRLRIDHLDATGAARKLPYTLARVAADGVTNRLPPGGVEFGTILLAERPDGPVRLSWPLVQIGPGESFTLLRSFHAGLSRMSLR